MTGGEKQLSQTNDVEQKWVGSARSLLTPGGQLACRGLKHEGANRGLRAATNETVVDMLRLCEPRRMERVVDS